MNLSLHTSDPLYCRNVSGWITKATEFYFLTRCLSYYWNISNEFSSFCSFSQWTCVQMFGLVWLLLSYLREYCGLLVWGGGSSVFHHSKSESKRKKLNKPPITMTQGWKSKRKILLSTAKYYSFSAHGYSE